MANNDGDGTGNGTDQPGPGNGAGKGSGGSGGGNDGGDDGGRGYRNPPKAFRYRPGQSGNPKGRPKGARNKMLTLDVHRFDDVFRQETAREVKIVDSSGRTVTRSAFEVGMQSLFSKFARGSLQAAKILLPYLEAVTRRERQHRETYIAAVNGYLDRVTPQIERRERRGIPTDDIVPHPDTLAWDEELGIPYFLDCKRPSAEELEGYLEAIDTMFGLLNQRLAEARDANERDQIHADIEKLKIIKDDKERKLAVRLRERARADNITTGRT